MKTSKEEQAEKVKALKQQYKTLQTSIKNGADLFDVWDICGNDVPYIKILPVPEKYGLTQQAIEERNEQKQRWQKEFANYESKSDEKGFIIGLILFVVFMAIFIYYSYQHFSLVNAIILYLAVGIFSYPIFYVFVSQIASLIYLYFKKKRIPKSDLDDVIEKYELDIQHFKYWERRRTIDYWQSLSGHQFENALAAQYRKLGCQVKVSKAGGDEGIDLIVNNEDGSFIVQCKAHKTPISPAPIRDFYGTMIHFNYRKGVFASTSGFTKGAISFAEGKNIKLISMKEIINENIL